MHPYTNININIRTESGSWRTAQCLNAYQTDCRGIGLGQMSWGISSFSSVKMCRLWQPVVTPTLQVLIWSTPHPTNMQIDSSAPPIGAGLTCRRSPCAEDKNPSGGLLLPPHTGPTSVFDLNSRHIVHCRAQPSKASKCAMQMGL